MSNPFNGQPSEAEKTGHEPAPAPAGWAGLDSAREPWWRATLLWASGLVLVLAVAVLATHLWAHRVALRAQARQLDALGEQVEELARGNQELEARRAGAEAAREKAEQEGHQLEAEFRRLEQEHRQATEAHGRLEAEMRSALESREVTISELAGKLTVNILDRVLFASGEADIKAEGQEVLRKVAAVLDQFRDRQIQVIGHTDNVPIRTIRFPSNWELSAARALAAVRFLTEQAGVDPRRVGAVGYGEYRPLADNATPEGRAQNRRIAIVVLPELLAAPDQSTKAIPPP
jgi:chemotaxis protein MotB